MLVKLLQTKDDEHVLPLYAARCGIVALIEALFERGVPVVLPATLCPVVVSSVLTAGARPLFADTDLKSGLADDAFMADVIEQEQGAGLLMLSYINGVKHPYPKARAAAKKRGWFVLENDTQACLLQGDDFTSDAALFSFGSGKVLDLGGGGALVFKDKNQAKAVAEHMARWPWAIPELKAIDAQCAALRRDARSLGGEQKNALLRQANAQEALSLTHQGGYGFEDLGQVLERCDKIISERMNIYQKWQELLKPYLSLTDPAPISPWRLMALSAVGQRDSCAQKLRSLGLDVGQNYPCVTAFFPDLIEHRLERAQEWGARVLNFWLDRPLEAKMQDDIIRILESHQP